ncbi:Calcitonin peptide-receptor component protein [Paramyrothecium foliicola]|nr:Calcitonin peptide-receptor component protein [Paramyrothecium foliicola]
MKVLEAQAAVLTNYEVFQHALDQRDRYKQKKRRGPPNYETVMTELLQYLKTEPSPLSQDPPTYTPDCVPQLLERLRPYDLAKGEVVMILNLRPVSVAALNTMVEDMGERYTEEQQEEMVNIVGEVLGYPVPAAAEGDEAAADGDVAMDEAAAS